jgi:hypothetical protein
LLGATVGLLISQLWPPALTIVPVVALVWCLRELRRVKRTRAEIDADLERLHELGSQR